MVSQARPPPPMPPLIKSQFKTSLSSRAGRFLLLVVLSPVGFGENLAFRPLVANILAGVVVQQARPELDFQFGVKQVFFVNHLPGFPRAQALIGDMLTYHIVPKTNLNHLSNFQMTRLSPEPPMQNMQTFYISNPCSVTFQSRERLFSVYDFLL